MGLLPDIPAIPNLPNLSDGPQAGLCKGIEDKIDIGIGKLSEALDLVSSPQSLLDDKLAALLGLPEGSASDAGDILDQVNGAADSVNNGLPSIPDASSVQDALEKCGILLGDITSGVMGVGATVAEYVKKITKIVGDIISSALEFLGGLVEAPIAFLLEQIGDLLSKFNIPDFLSNFDLNIECLDAICGSDISGKVDYVSNITDQLNLTSDGKFDIDSVLTTAGLSTEMQTNTKSILTSITDIKKVGNDAIAAASKGMESSLKTIIKPPTVDATKFKSFFA